MNTHKNARLTVIGRMLLMERIKEIGLIPAAEAAGISPRTARKWLARFKKEGVAGLMDRSSRPHRTRRTVDEPLVQRIVQLRKGHMPMRRIAAIMGRSVATISRVLARVGLSSLKALQPKAPVVRYEREAPGELLHMDTKKLARIERPGHRVTGDPRDTVVGAGWEVAHVAIDDHSRVAFVQMHEDETKEAAVAFLKAAVAHYKALGVSVKRLITDNGSAYRSRLFERTCKALGIKHTFTRPYHPQTNGKAERFIQTCLREWAYGRVWENSAERTAWLPAFLRYYNTRRPHSALSCATTTPAAHIQHWAISLLLPDFVGTTYCNSTLLAGTGACPYGGCSIFWLGIVWLPLIYAGDRWCFVSVCCRGNPLWLPRIGRPAERGHLARSFEAAP